MNSSYMNLADICARKNKQKQFKTGGPFGAIIVKNGVVVAKARNTVLKDHDATCHAEVNAIRTASKKLKTHDLSGCVLYTTCYPCPMCLSAIIWSNIKEIYYGNTKEDADEIGFRDKDIYDFINGKNKMISLKQINHDETIKLFEEYKKNSVKQTY